MSTTTSIDPAPAAAPARRPIGETPTGARAVLGRRDVGRRLRGLLTPADRQVLWIYLLTRLGLVAVSYVVTWLVPGPDPRTPANWLSVWERWDWGHYQAIAEHGYFGSTPGVDPALVDRVAFFPGFPLALRAVHAVVGHWTVAGLLISLVSGAVAVVALGRLAGLGRQEGPLAGRRAVAFLLLSPAAIFLAAGYTESLFLAFALPAWLAARRHHWALAGLLTACATTVRISGVFLAAALVVEFLLAHRGRWARAPRSAPWCLLPALPVAGYFGYLWARTGDPMAWKHAQERGWHREFHWPHEAFQNTWRAAFDNLQTAGFALGFQLELLAVTVGILLLAALLLRRRWAEAVYVGLTLWALTTSYWFFSVPRATLLWWPLWIGLAHLSLRRPWVREAYLLVVAPLMVVLAVMFTSGRWTG
ncbi:mannosyltransferase family protein [Streptomyces mayteni]